VTATASNVDVSRASRAFYRVLRRVVLVVLRVWFRMEIKGTENIPSVGGFILAPGGHRSILDTPIVSATTPRMLRYMGAEKFFELPGFGWFLRSVGGFPVERNIADREALRLSEELLRRGEPLVIFPESTRFEGPIVEPLKEGAVFLACRGAVPIVPVGIGGAERSLPRGSKVPKPTKMAMVIGEPIMPVIAEPGTRVKRSEVRSLTSRLHCELQALFDEAQTIAGA
jgi:1-acyl-sn-glycerol-3-phosphate acyltransferase